MKVYSYDRTTGAFLGEVDADQSPMEPGKFLVPAFATTKKPPAASGGQVPVFDRTKDKWKLIVVAPEPSPEEAFAAAAEVDILAAMRATVQTAVNAIAQALDFDSIEEAMTYADEPAVPKYQALARALRAWRSLVWFEFDAVLAEMKSGKPAPKDADTLLARLPKFVTPNVSELLSVRAEAADIPKEVEQFMREQAARVVAERIEAERVEAERVEIARQQAERQEVEHQQAALSIAEQAAAGPPDAAPETESLNQPE